MLNEFLISAAMLTCGDFNADLDCAEHYSNIEHQEVMQDEFSSYLTKQEREKLVRAWHLAVNKMNYLMRKSEDEANLIYSVSIRNATLGVITGTIGGLASKNIYAATIAGCLGGLSNIAGDSYIHFCKSKQYVRNAKFYAHVADEIQEELWRG